MEKCIIIFYLKKSICDFGSKQQFCDMYDSMTKV